LATVGVDVPDHGSRQADGGYILSLTSPQKLGRLVSIPLQGELDNLSLLMAVREHFGSVDAMPYRWWNGTWGDGVPDLDGSHVLYEGTSMGSVLGAEFTALAPELDGAFLQVGGSGIMDTLYHSILWPVFAGVEPNGVAAGDAEALVGAVTMLLDRGDNTYVLDRIRAAGTPFWLDYAAHDGVVPNTSSNRMTTLLNLPFVGTAWAPVPSSLSRVATMPADGTGATQIPTGYLAGNNAAALLAHVSFVDPKPTADLNSWLSGRVAAMGLSGHPAGAP
jgi:hypothetical protein